MSLIINSSAFCNELNKFFFQFKKINMMSFYVIFLTLKSLIVNLKIYIYI